MPNAPSAFRPCPIAVLTPRIIFGVSDAIDVAVQWDGEVSDGPLGAQYLFPIASKLDGHSIWGCGHTDYYRVAWIGPAKIWPNPDAARKIVRTVGDGDPEAVICYLCNHVPIVHFEDHRRVIAFAVRVVLLGDPKVGPIRPQVYTHLDILGHDPEAAAYQQAALDRFMKVIPKGVTVTFVDGTSATR